MTSGRWIGPFLLAEVLGEGEGTVLYRASRPNSTRPPRQVAVRVALDPMNETVSSAIAGEAEVLRAMDNPRIPAVYGHYESEAAVAMTYYGGATLADAIRARRDGLVHLNLNTGLDIIIEVAHALRHAHSIVRANGKRIIHGHLSPQRIRLTPAGEIVVVGFGAPSRRRSPAFTPPEIARGEAMSTRSDQWALGAMLTTLVLGESLYTNMRDPIEAAREGAVQPWVDRMIGLHQELEPVVRKLLHPDPGQRFDHEPELLKALLAASRRIGGTVNRRHLIALLMGHAEKLPHVRTGRPPVPPPQNEESTVNEPTPPSRPNASGLDEPTLPTDPGRLSQPTLEPSLTSNIELDAPSGGADLNDFFDETEPTAPAALPMDPTAPLPPDPVPAFLPSEIAGFITGGLLIVVGVCYCIWAL